MPPPAKAVGKPVDADWQATEEAVRSPLPPDFKAFVSLYGAGQIDGFLNLLDPAASQEAVRYAPAMERLLGGLRELRESVPSEIPHALHPEPGGLLPWAFSDNGDVFFWDTGHADPADWSIVIGEGGGPRWATHPGPVTSFLSALLGGSVRLPFLPSGWPDGVHEFRPYPENPQLARLMRLLPPSDQVVPIEGSFERTVLEGRLGTRLPSDYWAIVEAYGRGTFGGELFVLEPAADGPRAIVAAQTRAADLFRLLAERRPGEVPFAIHPELGGLLAWGGTASGAICFWRSSGEDPDSWPIVVRDAMRSEWFTHRGPISWFLSDLADGSIEVGFLAGGVTRLEFRPGA